MTERQHEPSTGVARKLRRNETEAEKKLWQVLRARQFLGLKFRRQSPVAGFVADFLCEELRIIVEADGVSTPTARPTAIERPACKLPAITSSDIGIMRL